MAWLIKRGGRSSAAAIYAVWHRRDKLLRYSNKIRLFAVAERACNRSHRR